MANPGIEWLTPCFFQKFLRFVSFVLGPIFGGVRWILWLMLFLMLGQSISAILVDIPTIDQVIKVQGRFVDGSRGVHSRSGLYGMDIETDGGDRYRCSCDAIGDSNCLKMTYPDHKALLTQIAGRRGELWIFPSPFLFGSRYYCYQISDQDRVYRTFDQSVLDYLQAKRSVGVYLIWFLVTSIVVAALIRIVMFINLETVNGKFGNRDAQ